jgi:hypothetical protein
MEILSFEEYDVAKVGKLPPISWHLAPVVKCWQQATELHYMISLKTANFPSHRPPRSPASNRMQQSLALYVSWSPDPYETLSTGHEVFHNSGLLESHAAASHVTHTRAHTWNRSVANWHTAEYLCTRHQRGSGSRRRYGDGLCLSRLIIKFSEVTERQKKKKVLHKPAWGSND